MVGDTRAPHCRGRRRDGEPCRAPATMGGYCIGHAPALEGQRAQGRVRGGRHKAQVVRLGKLVPPRLMNVYSVLEEALGQVHRGELDPRIAVAMSSLAGAMVRVLSSGELEDRLRRLEERIASWQKGRVA